MLSNGTLVIQNTMIADTATYSCVANNEYGEDTMSAVLLVTGELWLLLSLLLLLLLNKLFFFLFKS